MNKLSREIRIFLIGAAMGVANIIPGVSGGTIAVVFGIYEELMEALGNFITDKDNRRRHIKFLIILFAGSIVSILSLARALSWSFENYPLPTIYFFLGLIVGSIPVVIKSHSDMRFTIYRGAAFMVGLIAVIILALMQQKTGNHETTAAGLLSLGIENYIYFIFSGAIAASAMIIPGVSGSFILILLGVYWTVLGSLSGLTSTLFVEGLTTEMVTRLAIIGSLGIGVVIGILVFSRVMGWALKNYPAITMYLILGLIIGSLYQIYPGVAFSLHGALAVITFVLGVIISLKFGVEKGAETS